MSPKLEVLPLSYLCLKCVSNLLVHCLGSEEPCDDQTLTNYLSEATGEVLQDIIKRVLSSENLDASTRFSCLRVSLREDVRRLDTGMFPQFYYEAILEVIRTKAPGLQHLNLHGVWLREYPTLLISVIEKLKNLKVLIIPHMADDLVLQTAIKCDQLTVLDISGECNFTREGLMTLKSDTLKVLSIGMFGKANVCDISYVDRDDAEEEKVIVSLIKNFPNLNVLKTFSFIGGALKSIQQSDPTFRTKLKYIHDTRTSLESLDAIAYLCPNLESVHFNSPQDGVISKLGCLKRLNSLKVSACRADELQDYLNRHGDKLQFLKVNLLRDTSVFDVSQLCIACPELRTLELYKCNRLACLQPDNYFLALESLEMLYCSVGDALVRYFLMNTPFLRRLLVGDVVRMTDGDVFRLCADCEFASLEELWLSNARGLTLTSVELLMGHCPRLRVLGQLNGWDITPDDMDLLRAVILSTNTDLTLLPIETG
ncbi:uncharacterized protein [Atheta coriaria]|uniref:uncharacterized protein n=1 Tax=Dalotia coriaria TaxID=877792 RepID=UPI0031F4204E